MDNIASYCVSAWFMYPSMRQPDDIGPVKTFRKLTEEVVTFTERK